jgi:hypothetical protein
MSHNYPSNAMIIKFKPLGSKPACYRVWLSDNHYYWDACGNSGREETQEAAMRAAREYILMGVNGLKSHGEYHGVLNAGR